MRPPPTPAPVTTADEFLAAAGRFLFFTGKGGVGKTSLACAMAIALADRGDRVLLVSTDPASNLDEALGTALGPAPVPIPGVPGLSGLNVDPHAAAAAYRERLVGPFRDQLPAAVIQTMEEQLSGACTTEIAAFDEFSQWLGDPRFTIDFDRVLFDTAPTGHTLRLLALPGAWSGYLDTNRSGTTCLGPLAGLDKQRELYATALAALSDAARTTLVLVTRPQSAALAEAKRASAEFAALGIRNQRCVVNGLFRASGQDPLALALEARGTAALREHAAFLDPLPRLDLPLRLKPVVGLPALRAFLHETPAAPAASSIRGVANNPDTEIPSPALPPGLASMTDLLDELAAAGRGVIMTMGKGGVGKTTLAAALAVGLAQRGHRVQLSTTDPAAHVAATAGRTEGLEVDRIDPQVETAAYVSQVMATAGKDLDPEGRALLEEDLRSPCTEEIAVFRAFARTVALGGDRFVVLDTAPTGHTLLLLDATEAYHREIARKTSDLPAEVRELLPRLRDPDWTRILLVTVPEPTPVHEAAALQADLRRARIEPFAWIINQSLAAATTTDPLLTARATGELPYLREVANALATRTVLVPWLAEEPIGSARLRRFFEPAARAAFEI